MPDQFSDAQRKLQAIYSIPFPDDFFNFWQFMQGVNPEDPYTLPVRLQLVGAFEILGGLLDEIEASAPLRMHWRFYKDPPEFFTILQGDVDGLHFGYYYDDPQALPGCVCDYYHHDAYGLWNAGSTVFDTVQTYATGLIDSIREEIELGEYFPDEGQEEISAIEQFLQQMQTYCDRHPIPSPPARIQTTETWDGFGIVVPPETYRPLTQTRKADKLIEAQTALAEGFPGTALKFAKDLWSLHDPEWEGPAIALLQAAYTALNRPLLNEILQEHLASRDPGLNYMDLRFLANYL